MGNASSSSTARDTRHTELAGWGRARVRVIRDAVAGLGLPLARLEQRRHRLEEIFRDEPVPAGQHARTQTGPEVSHAG